MVKKTSNSIKEIYLANRCKGMTQAKSMERLVMFAKKDPKTMERVIRSALVAERSFNKKKCKRSSK